MRTLLPLLLALPLLAGDSFAGNLFGKDEKAGNDLFVAGTVPRIRIEVPPEGMATLREYIQVWRQKRPDRIDVRATIRDGDKTYTNVAMHLKGSYSFQPIDGKPSMTLNFDKFADGQRYHGLTKIHLNNSVQDPTYLCEQFGRELFNDLGVTSPRAGHALVSLNGRDIGLYVVIEGANKQFVKRHFKSAKGNLYDGGSGGDVSSALETDSGENPNDRSHLTNLVKAAKEPDPAKRLTRLEQVLDVERFITFAATEAFLGHWDGYALNGNNYRVFHDVERGKMVFMPHGLDQLFVPGRLNLNVTPVFKGMIAKALFSVPEARERYLRRLEQLSTNELRAEALHARVDKLAAQLRPALASSPLLQTQLDGQADSLKLRISTRARYVAQQLKSPRSPLQLAEGAAMPLLNWTFKAGLTQPATSARTTVNNRQILRVNGRAPSSSGAWRTLVFLDEGRYEFTGLAHTDGLIAADAKGTNGVILRKSGERSTAGITVSDEWKPLSYEFEVSGIEDVELVCEFRGGRGSGFFEPASMRLTRKGELLKPAPANRKQD